MAKIAWQNYLLDYRAHFIFWGRFFLNSALLTNNSGQWRYVSCQIMWNILFDCCFVCCESVGWGVDQSVGGFGDEPGIKVQLMNLIRSVRTVMRGRFVSFPFSLLSLWNPSLFGFFFAYSAIDCSEFRLHRAAASVWMKRTDWRCNKLSSSPQEFSTQPSLSLTPAWL